MPKGDARPTHRAWHWLLPSLGHWLWLVVFVVLLLDPYRTRLVTSDGDACMHWRVGEYMLETGKIIRSDVFSHTRYGQPIVTKEWMSQIIFALAGRLDGLSGVGIAGALVLATTFLLLHRQLIKSGADVLTATIVTLLAVWASASHWHARPHLFSLLLIVLWNGSLRQFEQDGRVLKLAVCLAVLTLVWANSHGGYLAGFIVLGAYGAGALIGWAFGSEENRRRDSRGRLFVLLGVGVVCVLVSLINPNGWRLHGHNLGFLRSTFFVNWLDEYSSTNFHLASSVGFLVWLAVVFVTLAVVCPKLRASAAILIIGWTYLALYSARNIPLLALVTAPILAPALSEYLRARGWRRWREMAGRMGAMDALGRGWPAVMVAAVLIAARVERPLRFPADRWPVAAVDYVKQHPDQFTGNLFNLYGWGGYLLVALPEHKVFVDGRADFYGEELVREYDEVDELRPSWMKVLDQYNVRWMVLPAGHRLNRALELLPAWRKVHSDKVAIIWTKPS